MRTTVLRGAAHGGPGDPASPVSVADPSLAALLESRARAGDGVDVDGRGGRRARSPTSGSRSPTSCSTRRPGSTRSPRSRSARLPTAGRRRPPARRPRRAVLARRPSQDGLPEIAGGPAAAEAELRARLAVLRAAAADLAAGLAADPPDDGARRGAGACPTTGAADVLAARHRRGRRRRSPTPRPTRPALGERDPRPARPGVRPAARLHGRPAGRWPRADLDATWLEIVAAVRPAVARLEAHQLRTPWPARRDRPGAAVDRAGGHRSANVVVYGPAAGSPGPVGARPARRLGRDRAGHAAHDPRRVRLRRAAGARAAVRSCSPSRPTRHVPLTADGAAGDRARARASWPGRGWPSPTGSGSGRWPSRRRCSSPPARPAAPWWSRP